MTLATVINYCTNDYRFLSRAIEEVSTFSSEIIVPVCDHFFDGSPENRPLLNHTYAVHRKVRFLEFSYDVKRLYTPYIQREPEDEDWGALWHSTARYLAFLYLSSEAEYVLFLDADEIVEGNRFAAWLEKEDYKKWEALWFSSYCYGLSASDQLPEQQQTALLARRKGLSPLKIFSAQERFGIFAGLAGPKRLQVLGLDGAPMIHHYSWVRPQKEALKKAATWGKRHHCDWKEWLHRAANEKQKGKQVAPYFDPLLVSIPSELSHEEEFSHVIRLNPNIARRKEIDALLY